MISIQQLADDAVASLVEHRDAAGDKLLSGNYTDDEVNKFLIGFLLGYVEASNSEDLPAEPLTLPSMNALTELKYLIEEKLRS